MSDAITNSFKKSDPYERMTERYDLSFGPFGEQDPELGEFFRQLFTNHGVHDVLDCACGTGRHLPMFRGLGCEAWGADIYPLLRDDQEALLKAAGFQAVDFYGGFNFSPYDKETSGSLITVAHK